MTVCDSWVPVVRSEITNLCKTNGNATFTPQMPSLYIHLQRDKLTRWGGVFPVKSQPWRSLSDDSKAAQRVRLGYSQVGVEAGMIIRNCTVVVRTRGRFTRAVPCRNSSGWTIDLIAGTLHRSTSRVSSLSDCRYIFRSRYYNCAVSELSTQSSEQNLSDWVTNCLGRIQLRETTP